MSGIKYDLEILYVQKLYYFMFLATFSILISAIIVWNFDLHSGLYALAIGLGISYMAMVMKRSFNPPEQS